MKGEAVVHGFEKLRSLDREFCTFAVTMLVLLAQRPASAGKRKEQAEA
jgi:hypothetical protein